MTKCFFYQICFFKFSGSPDISDICEIKWKISIDAFAMSDLSIFASVLKFSSKLISTHGLTVRLKLVKMSYFFSITSSYCWNSFELWSFLDCLVNSLTAGQLSSQFTSFFCVSNGLVFLIKDINLSFVFKNLFVKCFWQTKTNLKESLFVLLTSFGHICSKSTFLDREKSALSHRFYS